MQTSPAFYTGALDFQWAGGDDIFLSSHLSSHRGDGAFGQAMAVEARDVDALVRALRARGLRAPGDPDGNTICFVQR